MRLHAPRCATLGLAVTMSLVERSAVGPLTSLASRVEAPRLVSEADAQRTAVKRLPRFLSEADIADVHAAAATARASAEAAGFVASATYERQVREGGRTVWLNHRLRELLPELHSRMMAAAVAADRELWGGVLDDRAALALRSSEYHRVEHSAAAEENIPMPTHADHGSLVTIDLLLSDASDFEGGEFQTLEPDGSHLTHRFERGDALLLLSHKWHSVTALTAGKRNVLVSEIWEGLPRRCPQRCDQPWLPCMCRHARTAMYARADPAAACSVGGPSDAERLLTAGRDYWKEEAAAAEEARRQAEASESLLDWARRVKGRTSEGVKLRPGE